ncbi:hypothetical protein CBM2587_A230002 [Cupriavidus taiwanensis]|uniref:Uncharacterized protein n=1 Tax=Cupriavidus taiwanensis TaxID=164546 RepID=A0A976A164_9BURK|nr:hypothetical protein CBM2587_A230002 [Cupriavidus taiwanensis]
MQALAGAAPAPTPGDGHQTCGKPPSDAALGFFAIRRPVPLAPLANEVMSHHGKT